MLLVANEVHAASPSCFDGPVGQYKGPHALLLVAQSLVDVIGFPLSRTMPRSRSRMLRSRARAQAFCMLRAAEIILFALFRNRPYAVRHVRVTCVVIDIVESRYTPRSRMLADVLTSLPHISICIRDGCAIRFGAANSMASVFSSFNSKHRNANHDFTSITYRRIRSIANAESLRGKST